eukprot:9489221-Pyramimonas_sp.AAC.1
MGSSTEGSSGRVRMRHRHSGQRFVAPYQGALPKGPVARSACVDATPDNVSWPHGEFHRRLQWQGPYASTPPMPAHPSH